MSEPAAPTLVWYKSHVIWGVIISVLFKVAAIVYPSFTEPEDRTAFVDLAVLLASFVGDALVGYGRLSSNAQPLTLTEKPTST